MITWIIYFLPNMITNFEPNPTLIYLSWPRRLSDKRGNRGGGRLASHKHPDSRMAENIFFCNLGKYFIKIWPNRAYDLNKCTFWSFKKENTGVRNWLTRKLPERLENVFGNLKKYNFRFHQILVSEENITVVEATHWAHTLSCTFYFAHLLKLFDSKDLKIFCFALSVRQSSG